MSVAKSIKIKLEERLAPLNLEVHDESRLHKGHAGAPEGGESHFRILVISEKFEGLNAVARQRLINEILRAELDGGIHALSMKTMTPDEFDAAKE